MPHDLSLTRLNPTQNDLPHCPANTAILRTHRRWQGTLHLHPVEAHHRPTAMTSQVMVQ